MALANHHDTSILTKTGSSFSMICFTESLATWWRSSRSAKLELIYITQHNKQHICAKDTNLNTVHFKYIRKALMTVWDCLQNRVKCNSMRKQRRTRMPETREGAKWASVTSAYLCFRYKQMHLMGDLLCIIKNIITILVNSCSEGCKDLAQSRFT